MQGYSTDAPRVSVLIGCWNNAETLPRAIDSIVSQTIEQLELIVVDDGSTDSTPELVAAIEDPRVRHLPLEHMGIARSLILALGGYDPNYRYATEYDLWLRLAESRQVYALDEILAVREMGESNVAATRERAQLRETLRIQASALRRRRTLRGAGGLLAPAVSFLTPLPAKRALRRALGQAA